MHARCKFVHVLGQYDRIMYRRELVANAIAYPKPWANPRLRMAPHELGCQEDVSAPSREGVRAVDEVEPSMRRSQQRRCVCHLRRHRLNIELIVLLGSSGKTNCFGLRGGNQGEFLILIAALYRLEARPMASSSSISSMPRTHLLASEQCRQPRQHGL